MNQVFQWRAWLVGHLPADFFDTAIGIFLGDSQQFALVNKNGRIPSFCYGYCTKYRNIFLWRKHWPSEDLSLTRERHPTTSCVTDTCGEHEQVLHGLKGRLIPSRELRVQFTVFGVYMNTVPSRDSRLGTHLQHPCLARLSVSEVHDSGAPCILVELQLVFGPYTRCQILSGP